MKIKNIFVKLLSIALAAFLLLTATPFARAEATVHDVINAMGLYTALDNFKNDANGYASGDTIRLTGDIEYGNNIVSELTGKELTIDLNGHLFKTAGISVSCAGRLFVIDTNSTKGTMTVNGYLSASSGGVISPSADVILNASGSLSADGSGSSVSVNNVTTDSYGVTVSNGGIATVDGDITVNTVYSGVYGAGIGTGDGTITVNGDILINGSFCYGVNTKSDSSGGSITVNGSVTASGVNSSGVWVEGTSNIVSVKGNVIGASYGTAINTSYSGNSITVGTDTSSANVTATAAGGRGASIGFGTNHTIIIYGNVTANGGPTAGNNNSYGILMSSSANSTITVDGSVSSIGEKSKGVYITSGTVNIDGDVITTSESSVPLDTYGLEVSGGIANVGGNVTASSTGVYISSGSAHVKDNVTVTVPSSETEYGYSAISLSPGGTVIVDGNVSITGATTVYGVNISQFGSYASDASATVHGDVSASTMGTTYKTAYGVNTYNSTGFKSDVTVDGDVKATAVYEARGLSAYMSNVTVGGIVSASGAATNTGVIASGGSTVKVNGGISAASYIIGNYPTVLNVGGGTLNGTTGYFDYACAGGTTVSVKGWTLTVAAGTGGVAGIGGTTVSTGLFEAFGSANITASDTVSGYDFYRWTATGEGSFGNSSSASTTFTMPVADTTVTANFITAPTYSVDTSGLTHGSIAASPSSAEQGATVTLTLTPDEAYQYAAGSLKYSYGGNEYPLTVTGNTASFIMPAGDVAVSATFEALTVPTVTTTTLPAGTKTVSYSQTLTQSGNASAAWDLDSGSLPGGLSLSAAGVLSGTPSAEGTFTFTVKTENAGGSDTQELTLVIAGVNPKITTTTLTDATEDSDYSFTFAATGVSGYYWGISIDKDGQAWPSGLYINSNTGEIYGTPSNEISEDTTYSFTVTVSNWIGESQVSDSKDFTLTLHPAPEYALTLTAGSGGIIITGTSKNYEAGSKLSITAEPDDGYVFSGWTSPSGVSFSDETSEATFFYMPAHAVTVTATFVQGYNVTVPAMSGGSITAIPQLAAFGTTVGLTIIPAPGKQLKADSLKCSYGGNDYTITPNGNSADFTMPAEDVTISAEFEDKPALEVTDADGLYDALEGLESGDTIRLMNDIEYSDSVMISDKTLTIDLNGHNLTLSGDGPALSVTNGGKLKLTGEGELNVLGRVYIDDTNSSATVTSIRSSSEYYGAEVYDGGELTVTDSVTITGQYSCGVYVDNGTISVGKDVMVDGYISRGVYTYNGTVTVTGSITATGENCYGVDSYYSTVTVTGDVSAAGEYSSGIYANYGTAEVNGSVTATGDYCCGVYANENSEISVSGSLTASADGNGTNALGAYIYYNGMVTVNGAIAGSIKSVDNEDEKTITNEDIVLNGDGTYFEYENADGGFVRLKAWTLGVSAGSGGSVSDVSGKYRAGEQITAVATPTSGYSFKRWNATGTTLSSTTNASVSFIVPTANVTLEAVFEAVSSGGVGGQGQQNQPQTEISGNTATATTTTTAVSIGARASALVSQSQMSSAIDKAKEAASAHGGNTLAAVEIKVEAPTGATTVGASLPASSLSQAASGGIQSLAVSSPVATVSFDAAALGTIASTASGDVMITSARITDSSSLSPAAQEKMQEGRPVYSFSVTSGNETISQFGGTVTVSIPYTLGQGEDPTAVVIYYIDASGSLQTVSDCRYDQSTGTVRFGTTHFSEYLVGYNKVSFSDVAQDAWYYNAVSFLAAREITGGTGDGKFSPDTKLTRGQFITLLMKAYGISPNSAPTGTVQFADVGDTYYTKYLLAARGLGITGGIGNNQFAPERVISRQEMFVMLYNALKAINKLPTISATKQLTNFSDSSQVAAWAQEAVNTLVKGGIVTGDGNKLEPEGSATRAQTAQLLFKLLS